MRSQQVRFCFQPSRYKSKYYPCLKSYEAYLPKMCLSTDIKHVDVITEGST